MKGRPWSARRVMDFRLSNGIPSGFIVNPQLRLTNNGYLTTAGAPDLTFTSRDDVSFLCLTSFLVTSALVEKGTQYVGRNCS
jgi:hypothetical protein